MNELIEDYLRRRGARYFRGHHVDEYFYLVDVLVDGHHKRLHVHLEAAGPARNAVQVSISPDRYYPASARPTLACLAGRWMAGEPGADVVIHDSSDPSLVGLSVHTWEHPVDVAGLTAFVDHAVSAAIELFAQIRSAVPAPVQSGALLRDAG